jgi:hypothetical protein
VLYEVGKFGKLAELLAMAGLMVKGVHASSPRIRSRNGVPSSSDAMEERRSVRGAPRSVRTLEGDGPRTASDPVDFRECLDGHCHDMVVSRPFVAEWLFKGKLSDPEETTGMLTTRVPQTGFRADLNRFRHPCEVVLY